MINELYLQRAINIRKDYIQITQDISKYEKIAEQLAASLEERLKDLTRLDEAIKAKRINSIETAKDELQKVMLDAETDMNSVDKQIDELLKKMESLATEEKNLYRDIRQTYPDKKDDELRDIVHTYIREKGLQ